MELPRSFTSFLQESHYSLNSVVALVRWVTSSLTSASSSAVSASNSSSSTTSAASSSTSTSSVSSSSHFVASPSPKLSQPELTVPTAAAYCQMDYNARRQVWLEARSPSCKCCGILCLQRRKHPPDTGPNVLVSLFLNRCRHLHPLITCCC